MRYAGLQTLKWGIIHPWLEILPSKWWTPAMLSQNLDAIALGDKGSGERGEVGHRADHAERRAALRMERKR